MFHRILLIISIVLATHRLSAIALSNFASSRPTNMIDAIAFDAYGTLFDVYSVSALTEEMFPGNGKAVSEMWRDKQIDYTRLRTMCDHYKAFWEVTEDALIFTCKKLNITLTPETQSRLMAQYSKVPAFSENLQVLQSLQKMGIKLAVLSNGTPPMLESAVHAAGMLGIFDHLLSADSIKKYKTHPECYQMGPNAFGCPVDKILFVSSNCWDVCGATWFGYNTFWVNRAGAPVEELDVTPNAQGRNLEDLLKYVQEQNL